MADEVWCVLARCGGDDVPVCAGSLEECVGFLRDPRTEDDWEALRVDCERISEGLQPTPYAFALVQLLPLPVKVIDEFGIDDDGRVEYGDDDEFWALYMNPSGEESNDLG